MLSWFSRLAPTALTIQSEDTRFGLSAAPYNCIAWAAGHNDAWWWPDPDSYWPESVPRERTIAAFVEAFSTKGYQRCRSARRRAGVEKVAIYVDCDRLPTHAARQLDDGRWASKLGQWEDIEHDFDGLTGHDGQEYGDIAVLMARRRPGRNGVLATLMGMPTIGRLLAAWIV